MFLQISHAVKQELGKKFIVSSSKKTLEHWGRP